MTEREISGFPEVMRIHGSENEYHTVPEISAIILHKIYKSNQEIEQGMKKINNALDGILTFLMKTIIEDEIK